MQIQNNCPNCGRLITIDDELTNTLVYCPICEKILNREYDIIITEDGIETEIMFFKEKLDEPPLM